VQRLRGNKFNEREASPALTHHLRGGMLCPGWNIRPCWVNIHVDMTVALPSLDLRTFVQLHTLHRMIGVLEY
jgi:hypothetical protein